MSEVEENKPVGSACEDHAFLFAKASQGKWMLNQRVVK